VDEKEDSMSLNARKRADRHFSHVVRALGMCQRCGKDFDLADLDCAHIVVRRYARTRCLQDNAWSLCKPCHRAVDDNPVEFVFLLQRTIGVDRFKELHALAHDKATPLPDWEHEAQFWLEMKNRVVS
jgi:hypothetical protein